ncbi:PAS domain-containing protein [Leisingera caerulea]|uniref:PAS domain-containing protein n=1 Tax=Leisingera caerulea TaxID=506591 RepID=A0ABY5WYL6_LEICA|nr:PAS domain-containing protein [Leisingera caerulea]UWQ59428.1 PAS domain-containing protein [Leisingera caerulea]UWQ84456.1 PAS domain-containing protein [Leisingera caerulea]
MSFEDRTLTAQTTGKEAHFALDEVFFSRTDDRGVIRAGNAVFSRVAKYPLEELLGAPHKIIRHPDMPRAVFQLLWDTIKGGGTVGAYVKNRASDGSFYWVFAIVTPCDGGYLSARIKPTSPLLRTVEKEYSRLRQAEQAEGLSPEDSAARLLDRLRELGFATYSDFAGHALAEELLARDAGLQRPAEARLAERRAMFSTAEQLVQETEALVQEFESMRTIPHNLRVIASRIEPAGGPVTVLSQNYSSMSREMSSWFEAHVWGKNSNFRAIRGTVTAAIFVEGLARILTECGHQLDQEDGSASTDIAREQAILSELTQTQFTKARASLHDVRFEAGRIQKACLTLHRHFMALTTTRVLCKIECARLGHVGESLNSIIDELGQFQDRISARLEKISELSAALACEDK